MKKANLKISGFPYFVKLKWLILLGLLIIFSDAGSPTVFLENNVWKVKHYNSGQLIEFDGEAFNLEPHHNVGINSNLCSVFV